MEDYVLDQIGQPIIIAIDETDRLLRTNFHDDFFGLIRALHGRTSYVEKWSNVCFLISSTVGPQAFIDDPHVSPFNTGLTIHLECFSVSQIETLNQLYGSPLSESDISNFFALLGGHPYLTSKALYILTTEDMSWTELSRMAANNRGPFTDHLHAVFYQLIKDPQLQETLRYAIKRKVRTHSADLDLFTQVGLDIIKVRAGSPRPFADVAADCTIRSKWP